MGASSDQERAARFVREFSDDFVARHGLPRCLAVSQGLGYEEGLGVVRLFATIVTPDEEGKEKTVALVDASWWSPDSDEETSVAYLTEYLGIPKREARLRLKKADLL